jgi:Aspartyl protease
MGKPVQKKYLTSNILSLTCALRKGFISFLLLLPILGFSQLNVGKLITKSKYLELPLRNVQKEILLSATLKGKTYTFLLDTGAPFFISDSLQKVHKFPIVHRATIVDATGKEAESIIVKVDTLKVGPFVFTDLLALVLNMSNSTHQCDAFVGNFGSNLLRFLMVKFDAQKKKVILTDNPKLFKEKIIAPFSPATLNEQSDFLFPISINNSIIDTIQFDSGDGKLYQVSPIPIQKLTENHAKQLIAQGFGVTGVGSAGIPQSAWQVKFMSSLSFNGVVIDKAVLKNTTNSRSRVGRYLFNYGVLMLDYINKRYAFEKYSQPSLPQENNFGFVVYTNNNKVIAGTIWEGSEAEKKGMKSGFEILAIDGVTFSQLPLCEVEQVAKQYRPKNSIEVEYLDEKGAAKKITLTNILKSGK